MRQNVALSFTLSVVFAAISNAAIMDSKVAGSEPKIIIDCAVADAKVAGSDPKVIIDGAVADAKVAGSEPRVIIDCAVADAKVAGPQAIDMSVAHAKATTMQTAAPVRTILNLNAAKTK